MAAKQLSLWDNAALERGYQSLSGLRFNEAAEQFRKAWSAPDDQRTLEQALAVCTFWQLKVPVQSAAQLDKNKLESLVQDFIHYPFTPSLSGLKKALLLHLAEVTGDAKQICLSVLETIFDLLLALPDICAAVQLVQKAIDQYPEKKYLLYLLGQAQWRDGNRSEAKVNYVRACLLHPDETFRKRIEINGAKIQARQCGIAWLPAYCWLHGTLPMMPLHEEATYVNKDHKQAVNVYRLLVLSEKAAQKNDLKTSVRCRKEIKAIRPDLYHAYFRLLQQRKSLLILTPPIK